MAISLSGPHQVLSFKVAGSDENFLVLRMSGREQLNRIGEYHVETVGALIPVIDKPKPVVLDLLMGSKAQVKMDLHDKQRYFTGYVTRVEQGERHGRYLRYDFTLRPWLWFATRTRNSRIFDPEKTVKDIVDEVLKPYGGTLDWQTVGTFQKMDFCVQYNESDFDFVSRLLQRAGVNYFFEHSDGEHKMVLVNDNAKFKTKPDGADVDWADSLKTDGTICDWSNSEEVRFGKAIVWDHDYLATATKIEGKKAPMIPPLNYQGDGEVYEYPADLVHNSNGPTAKTLSTEPGDRAKLVFESLQSMKQTASARCNARDIDVGKTFKMSGHPMNALPGQPQQDGEYIVVAAAFSAEFADHEAIEDLRAQTRSREGFSAKIVCTKVDGPTVRPDVLTPKPVMRGPQTALVVGKTDTEIDTDPHGRVKVQFWWDRRELKNEKSSCWVRVGTPWASKNFGMISIPRVGDEVIVDFIDGDPDKPLIVGSVYNDVNPPIWKLPDNATMSGLKSRTSKKGDFETSNELRFEDKKDKEHIWLQAERDFYRYVKKKAFDFVGDEAYSKKKKSSKDVIVENWFLDVGKDVQHNFGKDLHVTVAGDIFYKGGATWQVDLAKDMTVKVGGAFGYQVTGDTGVKTDGKLLLTSTSEAHLKGTSKVAIEGAQVSIKASGGIVLDCSAGVTLKCGGSLVALTPAGVDIVGSLVKINSGGGGAGGSAATEAQAAKPAAAKKLEDITSAKATDYDKNFENPYKKSQ